MFIQYIRAYPLACMAVNQS